MNLRRLSITGLFIAWLVGGLYGAVSYGHDYYVYRGFDPPHDPAGVAAGHSVTARLYSRALHQRRSYLVYLPPGYDAAAAHGHRFPVLYLLHGAPGWPRQFLDIARAGVQLDVLVARHQIRPMVLVMPDGRNGSFRSDTEWADTLRGRYESLVLETVHAVDRRFATRRGRQFRAIAGNSEGAYGAVNVALRHLDTFSIVGLWSGYFQQHRKGPFARAPTAQVAANSPADYVGALAPRLRRHSFHAYLFSGLVDPDRLLSAAFSERLRAAGVDVRYLEYPGRHSWRLWRDETPSTLRYADQWFGGDVGQSVYRVAPR
ncbi:MAG: alpha/beta hydrolase-fold protein [Actinomycetota bacterium]|nr:alpha/beta hydrolase-fold protein [Actinomycetota bacterium]